jgi:phytoene dehydrogenase-like protein
MEHSAEVAVIGSGPNGLAAAVTLAQSGKNVTVFESRSEPGGGCRSDEVTLPGFVHDVCAAVFPLTAASRFFRGLGDFGVDWIQPDIPLAHPLDDGTAVVLRRSVADTARDLGRDSEAYRRAVERYVEAGPSFVDDLLSPTHMPRHPALVARFAVQAMKSAKGFANDHFAEKRSKALFGGIAAHSMLDLDRPFSAAAGLLLGMLGHSVGWPIPAGGAGAVVQGLVSRLKHLDGEIRTETEISSLAQIDGSRIILFDVMPGAVSRIAGDALPAGYRRRLRRYRHGPGVFKIDWALSDPIPWKSTECRLAGTVHVGSSLEDIARSESEVANNLHPERPFVLLSQPSLFDPSRAPTGKHVGWAYCHVPSGSTVDMTRAIERQIERFAPGFHECILARSVRSAADIERYNSNFVGGDIGGGLHDWRQLVGRPVLSLHPHSTPNPAIFICSSATPPGGGVHGLGGFFAAKAALRAHD